MTNIVKRTTDAISRVYVAELTKEILNTEKSKIFIESPFLIQTNKKLISHYLKPFGNKSRYYAV